MNGKCSVQGCNNPIKARKLCDKHYTRQLRKGTIESDKPERESIKTCLVIDCEKKHKAYGYCDTHYKLYKENGTPYKPEIIKLCGVEKCKEKHWGKGLCKNHFYEWRKTLRQNGVKNI